MRTDAFTKAERRKLRELANLAYERDLTDALRELAADFAAWKGKSINAFDLSDSIHEFHDGAARDLWSLYNHLKPPMIVAGALERGVLTSKDVPASLRAKLNVPAV